MESREYHDYAKAGFWSEKPESWHDFLPGVKRRILANSISGTMAQFRIEKGTTIPSHSHPHAQFGVCLEGGGEFRVGGRSRMTKKGDSYYIPPSVIHEFTTNSATVLVEFFTPARSDFLKNTLPAEE